MDKWRLKAIQLVSKLLAVFGLGLQRDFQSRLEAQKHESEVLRQKEINQIALQIAEDIRGPLMALSTLTHLSHDMSVDKKELLQMAVSRVRGIVEDLLKRSAVYSATEVFPDAIENSSELVSVVEPLLKEYKFSHPHSNWSWHNHLNSSGAFIALNALQLQRILSHILNNAIEASPENEISIEVTLMERADHYLLQVIDNGCGIPEEVLPKVLEEGVCHGKDQHSGLGLFEARKTLEALGGELEIRSRVGVGTQVILLFPKKFNSQEVQVM